MPKVKVNDVSLYYEIHGKGEPVIFVSGLAADHNVWNTVVQAFAKNYQVLVFDNRGVGQSDCPDYPYTIEMMAEDAVGLINKLGFKKVHLLGGSMGGAIVQQIAHKYPELVKSAVLENASYQFNSKRLSILSETRINLMTQNAYSEDALKTTYAFCYSNNFLSKPDMLNGLVDMFFSNPYPMTLNGYKNQNHACFSFDSSSWLGKIRVPTLLITSDEDLLVDPKDVKKMSKQIPNAAYYCFKGGVGHLPHVEQPETFNKLVLDFINKNN